MTPKHPDHVVGWNGSLEDLARSVGNMRYDKVAEFITLLIAEFSAQAEADLAKGRKDLRASLKALAETLGEAGVLTRRIWKVCKPYMPS